MRQDPQHEGARLAEHGVSRASATSQATRRPIAVLKPRLPGGAGRTAGIPSSVTIAPSPSGSPTLATLRRSPSILTSGALFITARPTIVWPLLLR